MNLSSDIGFIYVPRTGGTFLSNWEMNLFPNQKKPTSEYSLRMIHIPVSRMIEISKKNEIKLFTVVRDPYDQACSEYFYIKNRIGVLAETLKLNTDNEKHIRVMSRSAANFTGNPHYEKHVKQIYENKLSLEDFLDQREKNCVYSFYYDTKEPKDFDCVGMTEEIDKTIVLAKKMFNVVLGNGRRNGGRNAKQKHYETSYPRKNFEKNNLKDYELYYQGKEKFAELCSEYSIN
jgi:uncharacterized ubiquitin-like protein YukD